MRQKSDKIVSAETREDRISFVIGLVVVLAVLAVFVGLIVAAGHKSARVMAAGEISAPEEIRRGTEQTLTYTTDKLKKDDTVIWYANGRKIGETKFDGKATKLNYTPDECGKTVVRAVSGKYSQTKTLEIKKPILTVSATNATVTYGDKLPKLNCTVEGFVCDDTAEKLGCKFQCTAKEGLNVGVWEIGFAGEEPEEYEVCYKTAHLTVLPRTVTISNTVTKEYDQTNTIQNPTLKLDGVLDGDEVSAKCDTLYFASKNAGYQKLVTANICLTGKNAHNYVLSDDAQGYIAPKKIKLSGVTVENKYFDGTTKATTTNPGSLSGVLKGDSVAIGSMDVRFDGANVGKHSAFAKKIVLIGVDKDNYIVTETQVGEAEILTQKY